jgi:hypothetical protein
MKPARTLIAAISLLAAIGLVGAACAPPAPGGSGPAPVDWSVKGTQVTVNNVQDEVCVLLCVNREDEPYLHQIAFKVTIGQPGSASAWRTGSRDFSIDPGLSVGQSRNLTGGAQATATFNGIKPLDLLDALNPSNKMDIVGTYTWAMEEDFVGVGASADSVADVFEDALNDTLATAVLPTDESALVQMILDILFNNVGNTFIILLQNIPLLGLGDDLLGGSVQIGLGVTGALGSAVDAVLGGFSVPNVSLLGDNQIPPDIQGGGIFTLTGSKSFTQSYTGADGQHTYNLLAGPA